VGAEKNHRNKGINHHWLINVKNPPGEPSLSQREGPLFISNPRGSFSTGKKKNGVTRGGYGEIGDTYFKRALECQTNKDCVGLGGPRAEGGWRPPREERQKTLGVTAYTVENWAEQREVRF